MSVPSILYQLLIGPLQLFFEIVYSLAYRILHNPGLSIVVLSLCMNILVLPLYRRADAMQAEERELEQRLQPWIDHIKKHFSGDERYMILQTFYRQNHYKPTDALKGSLSLLLQVPFFIAAYHFLSGLKLLQGVSFGPIQNLGAPDAMFVVAGFTVNMLPILMTLINVVSGMLYTRGMPLKSKIQLYAMAGLFLVLLYQSPAGLVMYWTLNNLFSLGKNLVGKLKNPGLAVGGIASLGGAAVLLRALVHPLGSPKRQLLALLLVLLCQLPLVLHLVSGRLEKKETPEFTATERWIFRLGCLFLTLLLGALIPSAVLASSPEEFINEFAFRSPLLYLVHTMLLSVGTFVIWFNVFFALSADAGKRLMSRAVWVICGAALADYMFFGTKLGTISNKLQFHEAMHFSAREQLLNLAVLAGTALLLLLIYRMRTKAVSFVLLVSTAAVLCMSGVNAAQINTKAEAARARFEAENLGEQVLPLSKTGKNVVVLVLDRALDSLFPYLIHEKPELKEQFSGFTWYPNTLSHGGRTINCLPVVCGGYEYTPAAMNERDQELLVDKFDEGLKVLPALFSQEGYQITVTDPSFAGYATPPDLSIYDDIPNVNAFITNGRYADNSPKAQKVLTEQLNRNFFCYSLMKVSPLAVQGALYQKGSYNNTTSSVSETGGISYSDSTVQELNGTKGAKGLNQDFLNWYTVLQNLQDMTKVQEKGESSLIILKNDTTHEPALLQLPDYTVSDQVDNRDYEEEEPVRTTDDGEVLHFRSDWHMTHYHANMAAMLRLGEWFDYLKEQGVYDNTRIIVVADHGKRIRQRKDMMFYDGKLDVMYFNPLLLVKDFNATGEPRTDDSFMTNGDTPTIATEGLIDNPVNPYTGKAINSEPKQETQYVLDYDHWRVEQNAGTTYQDDPWYSVHDDIFQEGNWAINVNPKS